MQARALHTCVHRTPITLCGTETPYSSARVRLCARDPDPQECYMGPYHIRWAYLGYGPYQKSASGGNISHRDLHQQTFPRPREQYHGKWGSASRGAPTDDDDGLFYVSKRTPLPPLYQGAVTPHKRPKHTQFYYPPPDSRIIGYHGASPTFAAGASGATSVAAAPMADISLSNGGAAAASTPLAPGPRSASPSPPPPPAVAPAAAKGMGATAGLSEHGGLFRACHF